MNLVAGLSLFVAGLFFGSFGNVVSLRLQAGKSGILFGKSECPHCHHPLAFYENLPLVAWLILKGHCRMCKTPISWQYPAAELFFGVLFGLVGLVTGFDSPLLLIWQLVLVFGLGILFLSDLRFMDLPDAVTLPLLRFLVVCAAAVTFVTPLPGIPGLWAAFLGGLLLFGFFSLQVIIPGLLQALRENYALPLKNSLAAVAVLAVWLLLAVFFAHKPFERLITQGVGVKEEETPGWVGGGDFRLAVIMGVALGPLAGIVAVFLSYFLGSFLAVPLLVTRPGSGKTRVPFGPFMIVATVIMLLWGDALVNSYLRLIGL